MAKSNATTAAEYLAELPEVRRAVVAAVREVVLKALPEGYRETMSYGMIAYEVPRERYPDTYNGKPLVYAALAAQKNHFALYLNCVDVGSDRGEQLRAAFAAAGKELDMGKSCIRFQAAEDLALDAIGRAIAETPVDDFIAGHEAGRKGE